MTTIKGKSPEGNVDRELEIQRDVDGLLLHIHSPGNPGNGWAIYISEQELISVLNSR